LGWVALLPHLVADVFCPCFGDRLQPSNDAPGGQLVGVNYDALDYMSFTLEEFCAAMNIGQPVIIGIMKRITIWEHL